MDEAKLYYTLGEVTRGVQELEGQISSFRTEFKESEEERDKRHDSTQDRLTSLEKSRGISRGIAMTLVGIATFLGWDELSQFINKGH